MIVIQFHWLRFLMIVMFLAFLSVLQAYSPVYQKQVKTPVLAVTTNGLAVVTGRLDFKGVQTCVPVQDMASLSNSWKVHLAK